MLAARAPTPPRELVVGLARGVETAAGATRVEP
jgi:hypothetical protein